MYPFPGWFRKKMLILLQRNEQWSSRSQQEINGNVHWCPFGKTNTCGQRYWEQLTQHLQKTDQKLPSSPSLKDPQAEGNKEPYSVFSPLFWWSLPQTFHAPDLWRSRWHTHFSLPQLTGRPCSSVVSSVRCGWVAQRHQEASSRLSLLPTAPMQKPSNMKRRQPLVHPGTHKLPAHPERHLKS